MLKSFFKHYINQSSKKVHMQPDFEKRLDKMLFPHPAPPSFLSLISNVMKRYSLPYLAGFAILALVITSVLPQQINPLSPEEVLAKALGNYENSQGEIDHEEVLTESYVKGKKVYSYLIETYRSKDGKKELYIEKNPQTKEILSVSLSLTDEFGDTQFGAEDYQKKDLSLAQNLSQKDFEEEMKVLGKYDWFTTFKGEKIYCAQVIKSVEGMGKTYLTLAADDYSVYQIEGETQLPTEPLDHFDQEKNKLMNLDKDRISSKIYIQKLIQSQAYNYSQVEEGAEKYHLFKLKDSSEMIWFYFSDQDSRLLYYDTYLANPNEPSGFQWIDRTTLLQSESLFEKDFPEVFNPNRFEGLELLPSLEAGIPFSVNESACYNYKGQPLNTEAILKKVPQEALNEWEEATSSIKSNLGLAPIPTSNQEMTLDEVDPQLHLANIHFPVSQNAQLTQAYHVGHPAWDFALKGEHERVVYSALEGEVVKASGGGWNGGYGNTILIKSQVEGRNLEIRYAHLDAVNVAVGDRVTRGQNIATMGKTGRVYGPGESDLLHFEVILDGKRINPKWLFE